MSRLCRCLGGWGLALVLCGCGSGESASWLIEGADRALTIQRQRPGLFADGWAIDAVLRNDPDCQRRHRLKPTTQEALKIEVYSPDPQIYILRQGKRWYVASLKTCVLQAYREPPPEPGKLLGVFRMEQEKFRFVAEASEASAAPGEAPSAPPAAASAGGY